MEDEDEDYFVLSFKIKKSVVGGIRRKKKHSRQTLIEFLHSEWIFFPLRSSTSPSTLVIIFNIEKCEREEKKFKENLWKPSGLRCSNIIINQLFSLLPLSRFPLAICIHLLEPEYYWNRRKLLISQMPFFIYNKLFEGIKKIWHLINHKASQLILSGITKFYNNFSQFAFSLLSTF